MMTACECNGCAPVLRAHNGIEALVGHEAWDELARLALVVVALHAPLYVLQDVQVPARMSTQKISHLSLLCCLCLKTLLLFSPLTACILLTGHEIGS